MQIDVGQDYRWQPFDPGRGGETGRQALCRLEETLGCLLALVVPPDGDILPGAEGETAVSRAETVLGALRWLRLSVQPSGLAGERIATIDTSPVFRAGTRIETAPRGSTVWVWTRLPGEDTTRALCLDRGRVLLGTRPVLPGYRPGNRHLEVLEQQDGCWSTPDPDLFLGPRFGDDLEIWDPAVTPDGTPIVMRVAGDEADLRLLPDHPVAVRFAGLGLPRTLRQATRVVCHARAPDPPARMRIQYDGTIDFGSGLPVARVPDALRVEIALDARLDGKPLEARYDCTIPVEVKLSGLVPLAGDQPLEHAGDGSDIDGVRFAADVRPPETLDIDLRACGDDGSRAEVSLALAAYTEGRAWYRAPELGQVLASTFRPPAVVAVGCASRPDLGRIALVPPSLAGRWLPWEDGTLVFRPEDTVVRVERLEYPSLDSHGRTRWEAVRDLDATSSALFCAWGRLATGGGRVPVRPPIEPVDAGHVRLIDLVEARGRFWSRSATPSVEFLVPRAGAYTALAWIPPFGWEEVPCEPTRDRVRVALPPHLLEGMSGTGGRFWIGDGSDPFRWYAWCARPQRPEGQWWACAIEGSVVIVPPGRLLVDFQGLTACARLEAGVGPAGEGRHLLRLEEPWDVAGAGTPGKDGAANAPVQAAAAQDRSGNSAHYWIRALDRGPALLHLAIERHGNGWSLRQAAGGDADIGRPSLRRVQRAAERSSWEIHAVWAGEFPGGHCFVEWDGLVLGLTPPPDPTVTFAGWTWPRGTVGLFRQGSARHAYGLVAARDRRMPGLIDEDRGAGAQPATPPVVRMWVQRSTA